MQEYIPFFQGEKRIIAEKLAKYFEYSDLESKIHYDQENDVYVLSIPENKEKEAKKLYQAFYFVERERIEKSETYDEDSIPIKEDFDSVDTATYDDGIAIRSSDDQLGPTDMDQEQISNDSYQEDEKIDEDDLEDLSYKSLLSGNGTYVMKSEKYKDYMGTLYMFLILGLAGIIFVILNIIGVLKVLNGIFPNLIMTALFLYFLYEAISSGRKAKKLKLEVEEENQLTDKINKWLLDTVTEDFLLSISNSNLSTELDYLKKIDTIRDMLINEFGEQNTDYLDLIIEKYYSDTFGN
ncbi:MAG: hypothetical protein GX319_02610 [Clostridiales bacterium]|nr:hypothetical protein [Clostridiales bacterium]